MKSNRNDYSKLKKKVFAQMLLITSTAVATVVFLRSSVKGRFGERVAWFLENTFRLDSHDANRIYYHIFGRNIELFMFITIIVFLMLLFRFSISWFTKYFDEIIAVMNKLVEESDEEITMSPELDFMEKNLNQIKNTLEKKTRNAKETEQRKNDLVVYLAHDIKTPLTSVIGYLSLLEEAPDMSAEKRSKYVGITLEKAYRLEELINEFFEITRFNLQSIVLNKSSISLSFMLHQMADEFYPILMPQGKKAVVHISDDLTLWGDTDKLARVFNNILKNAITYSYENSTIEISAIQQGENIILTFTNQGDKISSQKLNTIFEKFYRLDTSRSSKTGGAGLGLSIAKEIVTAHGGTIAAESSAEHTVFTVKLPIRDTDLRKS